jgi:hypothetical protein
MRAGIHSRRHLLRLAAQNNFARMKRLVATAAQRNQIVNVLGADPLVSFVMNLNLAGLEALLAGVSVFHPHLPPNQIPLLAAEVLVVSGTLVVLRNDKARPVLRPLLVNLEEGRKILIRRSVHCLVYFLAVWLKAENLGVVARPGKWIKTKLPKAGERNQRPAPGFLVAKPKRKPSVFRLVARYEPLQLIPNDNYIAVIRAKWPVSQSVVLLIFVPIDGIHDGINRLSVNARPQILGPAFVGVWQSCVNHAAILSSCAVTGMMMQASFSLR